MLKTGDSVIAALNQAGFVRFEGDDHNKGEITLSFIPVNGAWKNYTVGGFFLDNNMPVAVIYSDSFFSKAPQPAPTERLWSLDLATNSLNRQESSAFAAVPGKEDWNINTCFPGGGKIWFEAVRNLNGGQETRYYSAASLESDAEACSFALFKNASVVYNDNKKCDVSSLPQLPEGFSWDYVEPLGSSIIAAWEERQDWNVGAAGFMIKTGTEDNDESSVKKGN
jgi:hypothetical protein